MSSVFVPPRPRVLVSRCLLGEPVRYNGSDKEAPTLKRALSGWAEIVPICPEIEAGMPVPRPSINLHHQNGQRVVWSIEGGDYAAPIEAAWRRRRARMDPIDGALLKAKSPSCGLRRVPLYGPPKAEGGPPGAVRGRGDGVVAGYVKRMAPAYNEPDLADPWRLAGALAQWSLVAASRAATGAEAAEGFLEGWALALGAQDRAAARLAAAPRRHPAAVAQITRRALWRRATATGHRWALGQIAKGLQGPEAEGWRRRLKIAVEGWTRGAVTWAALLDAHQQALTACGAPTDGPEGRYLSLHQRAWACALGTP